MNIIVFVAEALVFLVGAGLGGFLVWWRHRENRQDQEFWRMQVENARYAQQYVNEIHERGRAAGFDEGRKQGNAEAYQDLARLAKQAPHEALHRIGLTCEGIVRASTPPQHCASPNKK